MTLKEYFTRMRTNNGFWINDFKTMEPHVLQRYDEFKGKTIEFIHNINDEELNSTVILKNLKNSDFKDVVRIYSVYLDNGDIYFNISKDSLNDDELFAPKYRY